ncbi:MAG: hypothetical protein ACOYOB_11485 [Myxococcota bacterium]
MTIFAAPLPPHSVVSPAAQDGVAWSVGALGASALALVSAPGPAWHGSGTLTAAARELGHAAPAWLSWSAVAELLPLGPYAARVTWSGALLCGLALFLTVRLVRHLLAWTARPVPWPGLWALLAAAGWFVSGTLWPVATHADVHGVTLVAVMAALLAAVTASRAVGTVPSHAREVLGPLALSLTTLAMAFANEPMRAAIALPVVLLAAAAALKWAWRQAKTVLVLEIAGAATLGLAWFAFPLRHLAAIQVQAGRPWSDELLRWPTDGWAPMLSLLVAVGVALAAAAVDVTTHNQPRLQRIFVGLVLATALGFGGQRVVRLVSDPETNLADLQAPDRVQQATDGVLSPGALLLANDANLLDNRLAWQVAEGRRPDVTTAPLGFHTEDGDHGLAWLTGFARLHPEWRKLAVAAAQLQRSPIGQLLDRVEDQPVFAEQDPGLRIPIPYFGFHGFVHRLLSADERGIDYDLVDLREKRTKAWDAIDRRLGPRELLDSTTRAMLGEQHALQAAHALRRGWMAIARAELDRARDWTPDDPHLAQLEKRLGLLDAAWKRADTQAFHDTWQRWSMMDYAKLASPAP